MSEKIITFKVFDENGEEKSPRWVKAKTENDICPQCGHKMAVVQGQENFLYAYCFHCEEVFIAD